MGSIEKGGVTVIGSRSQCKFEEVSGLVSCLLRLFCFNPFTVYSDLFFSFKKWYNLWFIYTIMQNFASLNIFAVDLCLTLKKFPFLIWPGCFPVSVFRDKCVFRTADFRMVCNVLLAPVQLCAELYVFHVFWPCRVVCSPRGSCTLWGHSDSDGKGRDVASAGAGQ